MPERFIDVGVLQAYKDQHPNIMKEFPDPNAGGKLLVVKACDYRMMGPAHRGHFKTVQLTEKGNFKARLPLERRFTRLTYAAMTILHRTSTGQYRVVKDHSGNFFDGRRITHEEALKTFGHHEWINWKFPRKAKKQYKRFATIGYELGYPY